MNVIINIKKKKGNASSKNIQKLNICKAHGSSNGGIIWLRQTNIQTNQKTNESQQRKRSQVSVCEAGASGGGELPPPSVNHQRSKGHKLGANISPFFQKIFGHIYLLLSPNTSE